MEVSEVDAEAGAGARGKGGRVTEDLVEGSISGARVRPTRVSVWWAVRGRGCCHFSLRRVLHACLSHYSLVLPSTADQSNFFAKPFFYYFSFLSYTHPTVS